jgi:hypothetical protein
VPRPAARRRSLVLRDLGEETLVYDLESHRASCLNREAATVFYACDGQRSHEEIAALVSERLGRDVGVDYVALAIDRLVGSSLLGAGASQASPGRRLALRRMAAAAALALPTVTSVLAPEPAQAQTCLPKNGACMFSAECCSGCCKNGMCKSNDRNCDP